MMVLHDVPLNFYIVIVKPRDLRLLAVSFLEEKSYFKLGAYGPQYTNADSRSSVYFFTNRPLADVTPWVYHAGCT